MIPTLHVQKPPPPPCSASCFSYKPSLSDCRGPNPEVSWDIIPVSCSAHMGLATGLSGIISEVTNQRGYAGHQAPVLGTRYLESKYQPFLDLISVVLFSLLLQVLT